MKQRRIIRLRLAVAGRVQGVGFRPALYRLAQRFGLTGLARNTNSGVWVEIQGLPGSLDKFVAGLRQNPPRQAVIESIASKRIKIIPRDRTFRIAKSKRSGDLLAGMPPDLAICAACRRELFARDNRRHLYPFINCTDCGPRYTIINALPYDRARTSMKHFRMCPECRREFGNPADRRFEAQPDACAVCGPTVRLVDAKFRQVAGAPFEKAAKMLKAGKILAVKGIGGYHLCCAARNGRAVRELRRRKRRPHKPFAVMFRSVADARKFCVVSAAEEQALKSVAAPVVALRSRINSPLQGGIAPDTRDIGVFLPYSPLHCILLEKCSPLVMTSGNLSDEPIAISAAGLKSIMPAIADAALVHDREILRRCDDSVLKIFSGRPLMLRRSRGYVPAPLPLPLAAPPILACGADLKNTVCVTRGNRAFLSAHIGDLDDLRSFNFLRQSAREFIKLLGIKPRIIAHDLHPDYFSTRFACGLRGVRRVPVQHHHAHIASCIAEHDLPGKVIGVALDGTGYGEDGTIWGGEILVADLKTCRRAGHFKQYRLPGGEAAIRHPARMAASIIMAELGPEAPEIIRKYLPSIDAAESRAVAAMAARGINAPLTSSAGRLFDAVSALLGFSGEISYEGQAAVRLQTLADKSVKSHYPYEIQIEQGMLTLSFAPAVRAIIAGLEKKMPRGEISGRFHNTVAAALAAACVRLRGKLGLNAVALSGGVFQNELLAGKLMSALNKNKFNVYINRLVPPNDGGIALGQAAVAAARFEW